MGTQPPSQKWYTAPPIFGQCLLWSNGWMDQDPTWYGCIDLGPGNIVLDGDPVPPKGHGPQFLAHVCSGVVGRQSSRAGHKHPLTWCEPFHLSICSALPVDRGEESTCTCRALKMEENVENSRIVNHKRRKWNKKGVYYSTAN